MPRERIHTTHHRPTPNGAVPEQPTFSTEVEWGRDSGCVQVASIAADGADRILGVVEDWLDAAGIPATDVGTLRAKLAAGVLPDSLPLAFDGWHASLDQRADVNRLIRVLRTARDQAFGRDE